MIRLGQVDEVLAAVEALAPAAGSWVASDADGTLWAADVAEVAWVAGLAERAFRPEAARPLAALVTHHDGTPSGEPHRDAALLWDLYLADRVSDRAMVEVMSLCWAGWDEAELRAWARPHLAARLGGRVYATTEPLLRGLLQRGLSLAVVSGSPQPLVQEAVALLDLPARPLVVAVQPERSQGRLGERLEQPVPWEEGKVAALAHRLGAAPDLLVSLGDTWGDWALLQAARGLRLLVQPRPGLRRQAEATPGPWWELRPERTVAGDRVEPPRADRAIEA